MSRPVARGAALAAVLLLLLLAMPRLAGSYVIDLLFTFFLYAVLAQGWNLMAGYCGLLSFGNQMFIGVGGFAVAVLHYYFAVSVWLALPLAGVVSALLAYLVAIPINGRRARRTVWVWVGGAVLLWAGYEAAIAQAPWLDVFGGAYIRRVLILLLIFIGAVPVLRLQGAFFAVASWLIAASFQSVFTEWKLVGAGAGMQIASDASLAQMYYAALLLLVAATGAAWAVLRSRFGLALTAIRDDEEAAATAGVEVHAIKLLVFVLSGTMTGLAGGLYFINVVTVTPSAGFTIYWSAAMVFATVAGGMGTLGGPIIGAALFVVVEQLLNGRAEVGQLLLGVCSILLVLLLPQGLLGWRPWRRGPRAAPVTAKVVPEPG
jgi:branched-chain amino acid transport system permease protein